MATKSVFKRGQLGLRRESWLKDYTSTPNRPIMWRVYERDDATTRKNEELFQAWRGVVDFSYRRPFGQVEHPKWMRQKFAEKKVFELEPETLTERIYLGYTANFIWSHWSRRGASIPPITLLETAISEVKTPKDLGYATKMFRSYRQYFNVHIEHDVFTSYMDACLRTGCPDVALYALNQARWLGFSTIKECDRDFLKGKTETLREWNYSEHVEQPLEKIRKEGNPHKEAIAEVQDFSPFSKFWRNHESEGGWWVMPWDKDPGTRIIEHYWRHPKNVDIRHGSQYTEWTAFGSPLATNDIGEPTDPIGDAAVAALAGGDIDDEADAATA